MARKDWKKHLLRVKQIADQNLGRVEKSEALTANLQVLEKKVELFSKVYYSTGKKLQNCVQGLGHDAEKRMKKLPEYQLSQSLIESSSLLSLDSLLGQIFQICGDAQGQVANKRLHQEMSIEKRVLAPIHSLLEVEIPAIQKHKKTLQKMVLDMDSSKTRFVSATKQQSQGNNTAAKVDSLRDEYDEACYRVDQSRDQLATEMFTLASKEAELSQILLELIKCQAEFHKHALENLEKRIPQMEEQIGFWTHMPVYGRPLDDHLRRTEREIALVLEECIKNLCTLGGLEEEGLFRIAGAANKVKKLKAAFDSEQCHDIAEEYDVHCIAGALKLYLRELPDPLMASDLYPNWMQAAHLPADQRLQALAEVVSCLPESNYNNLRYLIKFLQKMTEFQDVNKMSPSNIAIVMGPNLIWPKGEGGPSVLTTSTQSAIVEALISNCDYFFPGDIDFWKPAKGQLESKDIMRDKAVLTQNDFGGKRHGLSAGLTMTHQSLIAPVSAPVAFSHNSKRDQTPEYTKEPKVSIRVDGSPEPEASFSKENSPTPSASMFLGTSVPTAYTSRGTGLHGNLSGGASSDSDSNGEDIIEQIMRESSPPVLHGSQPDLLNSVPSVSLDHQDQAMAASGGGVGGGSIYRAPTPDLSKPSHTAQNLIGAIHFEQPSPMGSQENMMTASTGNLQFTDQSPKNGGASPKPPRRMNKKPAPLPPGERPSGPAPPPPSVAEKPAHGTTSPLPYPVKPPLPDRPLSNPDQPKAEVIAKSEVTSRPEVGSKPDRPPSPTRSRSTGGSVSGPPPQTPDKPDKPEKPSKPAERLYPNLPSGGQAPATQPKPRTSSSTEGSPQSQTRVEHSPVVTRKQSQGGLDVSLSEKPPVPPPPNVKPESTSTGEAAPTHRRTGSSGGRPPRPTPPPPPPPGAKPSPVSEEVIQRQPSTGTDPNEQTYL